MEIEDNRLVVCEKSFELFVAEAVGVIFLLDELEEIDHVHETDFDLGEMLAEKGGGGEGFLGYDVAAGGHDYVGLFVEIIGSPAPDSGAFCAMCDGVFHVEVLKMALLVCDDDVDVALAAEAVVANGEETVGIWGKVDTDDLGALVGDDI